MIHLKEGYYGPLRFHDEDISIIVLQKGVSFSNGVAPVCIDWNSIYNVKNGDQGKVNMLYYIVCNFIRYIKYNFKLYFWLD